jgi:hypothetical protein
MEGILLGSLSYLGHNYTNKQKEKLKENTLENFYDSNIERNMNKIEQSQSKKLVKEPDFYKQFDSLKFNNNYQETQNSYFSDFTNFTNQEINNNQNMTHSNMTPFTSRRDLYENFTNQSQKYEKLSGNDSSWRNKKEIEPLFEPMQDLTNPFGMKVMTGELEGRYIASNKNNYGNLPFQTDVKVLPGIDGKETTPYAVTRIAPRNVDDLRSEINKKVSYESKPLETIKKGELRGTDFNISRYKVPTYREVTTNDFVGNSSVTNGVKVTGEFAHIDSQRGEEEYLHMGHATDSKQGQFINQEQTYFTDARKENYLNDFTHSINAVNTRPVFLNTESYTSYENQRLTSSTDARASGINMNSGGSYHIDRKDVANTTLKEQNIHGNTMLGVNGSSEAKAYVFSNDAILPMTLRNTQNFDQVLNPAPSQKNIYVNNQDQAKYTIKESTINKPDVANISSVYQNLYSEYCDQAKYTIKESTINKPDVANVNSIQQNIYSSLTDNAKHTVKESTINKPEVSNINSIHENVYSSLTDEAKKTIREMTGNTNYTGITSTNIQDTYKSLQDEAKKTIRENTGNTNYTGGANSTSVQDTYKSLQDDAKRTIRENTGNTNHTGGANSTSVQDTYKSLQDEARKTIRENTGNTNHTGGANSTSVQDTYKSLQDDAKKTIRENTGNTNYTGVANSTAVQDTYKSLQDEAKNTIREITGNTNYTGAANSTSVRDTYKSLQDEAKTTIREITGNTNHTGAANSTSVQDTYKSLQDDAKRTIREDTGNTNYTGVANSTAVQDTYKSLQDQVRNTIRQSTIIKPNNTLVNSNVSASYSKTDELARTTIKETVLHEGRGNVGDSNLGHKVQDKDDTARVTIKQTTLITNHVGAAIHDVKKPKSQLAEKNMIIDDKRQTTAVFNRPGNAKSDTIRGDINKDTVRFNDKRLVYGYVSAPSKPLDNNITPLSKTYTDKKTSLNENNYYRVDPIYIDTLNNNPLVNDIYHQKNIDFNKKT